MDGGAGANLAPTLTSDAGAIRISVVNSGGRPWLLTLRRTGLNWPQALSLECRRSGDGLGAQPPVGGLGFSTIGDTEQVLFGGQGDVRDIPLQLRLEGMSIAVTPALRTLSLTFMAVER
jgi:hypothetical protein